MSTTIKLRRSAVPGRVPTVEQLELGEIAINTADGKLYFKQFDPVANVETIIDASSNLDPNAILDLLKTVDGAGSGLDADTLDGETGSFYLDWNNFTNTTTGVTPGTYGSASLVPVLVVDEDGRITSANTVSVAGVSAVYWSVANNTYTIETADGGKYDTLIDEFSDLTVSGNAAITDTLTANTVVVYDHIIAGRLSVLGNIDTPNETDSGNLVANNAVIQNLEVANDIIVGGLVDGRDIATDGAKLDLLEDGLDLTLVGKVTGFASSNTGVMTLTTELANTGVIPGVYGSSTAIQVFTVDEDGRLTTANTVSVAGVDDFVYTIANNTITLTTGDGSSFNVKTTTAVELTGKVTGSVTSDTGVLQIATELANTGVVPGSYGSSTAIPILTIDEDGRITVANTAAVAGVNDFYWTAANNTLILETGDGSSYLVPIDTFADITANTVNGRDITADGLKLDGIEPGATADQTAQEILALLLTVDGANSGIDADKIDGYDAATLLDEAANNAANLIGAGEVTITATNGVIGGGVFNLNDANNHLITIEHADTSSVADVSNSNGVVITGITFDTFGHTQTVTSTDLDTRYYTETELNNGVLDTRYYTETELNNGVLDTRYYTETELDNGQLDNRYYTETEADARFVNVTGDTMSGNLTVNANISQQESTFISTSVTLPTSSQATLYAFPHTTFAAAEILITAINGSDRHITKLLVTHDGTTAIATEYGVVYTNAELASYDVSISGPLLSLLGNPTGSGTTFKIVATLIDN